MPDRTIPSFGVIGLGRIGGSLALQALAKGHRVVGFDPQGPADALRDAGLVEAGDLAALRDALAPPRAAFLYVPAGAVVDTLIDDLAGLFQPGDVIVDGGNSYWGDSIRRQRRLLAEHGVHLVDCGTSGGVRGAEQGACFMAGGRDEAIAVVEAILRELSVDGGYVHCGPPGSGHFVKLVHNGIEFGMLQAIGEGVQLLEHHRDPLPIADILHTWTHGSVIRSWLIELMEEEYRALGGARQVPTHIEDTGEVNWLVEDAMKMDLPIPVIAQSVMQLMASRDRRKVWAQAVSMMRHGFGEHPYGESEAVAHHRSTSRVGPWLEPDVDEG